jgi:tRNA threonylcarbamoyl adenosine modification protein (Sua5/YciO/YrdC/YwlC family)
MASAIIYKVHPDHPEAYKIGKAAAALENGAILLYPSDTIYAIGCDGRNRSAVERLRAIKPSSKLKLLTLLCPSLADISRFAFVEDAAFKLMKSLTPGPYTFVLKGTKEVPRVVLDVRRSTVGVRVPDHPVCQALMNRIGGVLVSSSAKIPGSEDIRTKEELFAMFAGLVDVIIDDGAVLTQTPSTIIDLTSPSFEVLREGLGMEALQPYLR